MKKTLIKFLVLALALCTAILLISACDANDNTGNEGDVQTVTVTVTFDSNGGVFEEETTIIEQSVNNGSTLIAPTSPTRTNFQFSGWALNASGSKMWDFAIDKVTGDLTLYAIWEQASAKIFSVENAAINEMEIYMMVDNNIDSVSLANKVVCSLNSSWRLYYDKLGQMEIPTKIAAGSMGVLLNGINEFYIVVTSMDNTQVNVYKLTIFKSFPIKVFYYDGEDLLYEDDAFSGYEYQLNYTPEITGYNFNGWYDIDGELYQTKILQTDLYLHADKTAKTYIVNLDSDGAHLQDTEKTMIYGSSYNLPVLEKTGHKFLGWMLNGNLITNENGNSISHWSCVENVTLTAKFSVNSYLVSVEQNKQNAGSVTGLGEYKYHQMVTITATTNKGYTFLGWFNSNERISEENSYSFQIQAQNVTITAKWELIEGMDIFEFNSTSSSCIIIGLKDKSLDELIIPNCVTSIDSNAFYGCTSLKSVVIPNSISYIGYSAFSNCSNIKSVVFEENSKLGMIEPWTFSHCSALTNIEIPDSVSNICSQAFDGCSSLERIRIPSSVNTIGGEAFYSCSYDLIVYCEFDSKPDGWNSYWNALDGAVDKKYSRTVFGVVDIIIEDNIKYCLLSNGTAIVITQEKNIVVANIKESIIYDGQSYNVNKIEEKAFYECTLLSSVSLPNSVKNGMEEKQIFYGCSSLKSIKIPDGVNSIGEKAFYGCSSLTTIEIPSSVSKIKNYAFARCTSLSTVVMKNNVREIGVFAFSNCSSLISIEIPDSVTIIGNNAFYRCTSLKDVHIGDSALSIGRNAFEECLSLVSIVIPKNVSGIGYQAFEGCSSLTIYCEADSKPFGWDDDWMGWYANQGGAINRVPSVWGYNYIVADDLIYGIKGNVATVLGKQSFDITVVNIKENITYNDFDYTVTGIGDWTFKNCTKLTSVVIPDSVISIGYYAFYSCKSLKSVVIPDSVTSIDTGAFSGCSNLTIYCEAESKPDSWNSSWNSGRPVVWGYKEN